jgi:hypothetical protein
MDDKFIHEIGVARRGHPLAMDMNNNNNNR